MDTIPVQSANDDEEKEVRANPELENALTCPRAFQQAAGIPLSSEEEERALIEWIAHGGRIPQDQNDPEHPAQLDLDAKWRRIMIPSREITHAAQLNYNLAQVNLLKAIAMLTGGEIPVDIASMGETFAMVALDKIHRDPEHPGQITVEVIENVTLLLESRAETEGN